MHYRLIIAALLFLGVPALFAQPKLELKAGDHIAIIGNALPDRMQHSGYLETLLYAKFPQHELVVRTLAVSGDEVIIRHRSENFGSPDDWLRKTKADVVFAYFGYNESFKGSQGIDKFKADLDKFLKELKTKDYSGHGAPRIVLFSPTADEKHQDPNFPDPAVNNAALQDYTDAMGQVAQANQVQFVNLFMLSQDLYAAAKAEQRSLTVNGHYLTEEGDRRLAPLIFQALLGEAAPVGEFEPLRRAVNKKNAEWHARYRTIDGYNVYGGRSKLVFENGKGGEKVSNYHVMQEEMAQRDVLTAQQDRRLWAVAQSKALPAETSELPPVARLRSNKPGPHPDESHTFLSGEAALGKMTVHSGMKVNLFASEEQFPELVNPVQMAWDSRGRLWVAAWLNYPERTPESTKGDSLLVFTDTDGDGKADTCTPFIDDLNAPTGFQFYRDGVLLMQAPDLWFVRDTDGDGKADWKERVLMGMDSADSHHTANAICLDPGGSIYLSDGVFHRTQVETSAGPVRNNDAAIYRFEPRTGQFETYISYGFANPHGRVFDRWGNDLVTDATGNNTYFGPAFSGCLDYPAKHPNLKQFWDRPSRPCPGTGLLTSRHFPEEFQGNFLNCNVIGFQGIYRVKVSPDGSGLKGETLEHLVSSSDPNFRPSAVQVGPDGALYFLDWHNPIIGHMQHHIRDPNRDHDHGRIYRISYEGRPLLTPPKIHGQPVPALLALLKSPEDGTRELAKVELGQREAGAVISATKQWVADLDASDPEYAHHLTEALWVHQWLNVVDPALLKRQLRSTEPRARAAATRVLCYWRDRVPDALPLLKIQAGDAHPRVRLEAVRAASFFRTAEAADVALAALNHPTDYYLDYTLQETIRQLEPIWRGAISNRQPIAVGNPAGINYLVKSLSTAELSKLPPTPEISQAIVTRPDILDGARVEAFDNLAKANKTTRLAELLKALETKAGQSIEPTLARLLPMQPASDLKAIRPRLVELATQKSVTVRPAAWASLAAADETFDRVWRSAEKSPEQLIDLVSGIPLLIDPDFRGAAYDKVRGLLSGAAKEPAKKPVEGRYVRIELPRRGTLTLAEVQVMSEGRNIASQGKASQSSSANNGSADRAIDGKTDGSFSSGTQTHTRENERNPWWELDLGTTRPIESVVVWNRTEENLGQRLEGFALKVLDDQRHTVAEKENNPAPTPSARIPLGPVDASGALRRAAIRAAVSMPRDQASTFSALTEMIVRGEQVVPAAQGLRVMPRSSWPKVAAGSAAVALVEWAQKTPAAERTSQDYIETVQVANDLAGLMPSTRAQNLRKELRDLSVATFVIKTVREQMRYDTPRLVVEAGKPFEIIIENDDFMPHNLVVVYPNTRQQVAEAAATMAPDSLDSKGRAYTPKSPSIIDATKMLEPGQKATLKLTAPEKEGEYQYVCTYPEHWKIMWGQLIVTKDVDRYLAAHPEAKQAAAVTGHDHH